MRRCRFHVIMPDVPGTSADISKLSQPFETMKLAGLKCLTENEPEIVTPAKAGVQGRR